MASIRKRNWTAGGEDRTAWVVDYKDQSGTRRLKTFKKKKEADAFRIKAGHEISQGTHTPASASITVAEAAENWLKRAELEGCERSTVAQYRQHVDLHINPLLGTVKLSDLTAPGMKDVKDRLLEKLSRSMAKKVLSSIKSILREARERRDVSQNVADTTTIKISKRHKRKLEVGDGIPSKQEIQQILKKAHGRWRPLLVTAIFTGMRASELRGLSWPDVDFDAKTIRVHQRADRYNVIGSPKSDEGEREVPMSPMVVNTLKEWKLACPKGELNLVFPNGAGNVEALHNIHRRGFGSVQEVCGMMVDTGRRDQNDKPIMRPKYGMHALRHFYASWIIDQGFMTKHVQKILGHSSSQMTLDVYGHLFLDPEDDHAKLAMAELKLVGS